MGPAAILLVTGNDARFHQGETGLVLPCMTAVGNRPVIEHAVERLGLLGVERVHLVAEPMAARVLELALGDGDGNGPAIAYHVAPPEADLSMALASVGELPKDQPVIVQPGDALSAPDADALLSRLVAEDLDGLVIAMPAGPEAARAHRGRRFSPRGGGRPVLHMLGAGRLDALRNEGGSWGITSFEALGPRLSEHGWRIDTVVSEGAWRYEPGGASLLRANRMVLDDIELDVPAGTLEDVEMHGRVRIHPTAAVRGSTVRGPVTIGADATVTDSHVGPYTSIGAGAVLDGVEVDNSVLLERCEVRHVGARLEGCVIGPGAFVGRSFNLPRALHLQVGPGARIWLS